MPRELTIKIQADNSQAKPVLTSTEQQVQAIIGAASNADKQFEKTFSVNLPKALGIAAAAIAAVDFGQMVDKAIDAASKIADFSQRTGIGAEALQKLKFAAEQSGSSLDA